jgi:hypothetical protein
MRVYLFASSECGVKSGISFSVFGFTVHKAALTSLKRHVGRESLLR